jgi:transcription elongation factor Elf1
MPDMKRKGTREMAEAVTFWLDNKVSSGVKVAEIGQQLLVSYRDKFYVIEGGAAKMRGSRPLHYSKSSLPAIWKKAMRGILPPAAAVTPEEDNTLPRITTTKRERTNMEKPATPPATQQESPAEEQFHPTPVAPPVTAKTKTKARPATAKGEAKPDAQSVVTAACPYCNHKNELALEKGKNGKPFFTACARCERDFAVRFVPVTVYQAQVAAFK